MKERNCSTVFKSLIDSEYFLQKEEEKMLPKNECMKNLGPSVCGSNQMQAFQARVCNLANMGAVPHKNSMATRRLHYGGMAEMQCWLGPSQVPQPTCYWK